MQYQISIPEPCHENWEAMTPDDKGRHCAQCCKTVVDFTGWSVDEISMYLFAQQQNSVCGRFREEQLTAYYITPETYLYQLQHSGLTFLKRIAALILFVFCLSSGDASAQQRHPVVKGGVKAVAPRQERPTMGAPIQRPIEQGEVQVRVDTSSKNADHVIMGLIAAPVHKDTAKMLQGKVKYVPPPKK